MAQDECVVYHSRPKLIVLAVYIGLIMTGFPVLLITTARKHHTEDAGMWIFLALFELFFIPNLHKAIRLLIHMKPALIINEEGVLDDTILMGACGWIPWENIARFEVVSSGALKFLCITPRNQAALLKGKPLFTKFNMLSRKLMPNSAPVGIMNVTLPIKLQDIYAEMQRRQPMENSIVGHNTDLH